MTLLIMRFNNKTIATFIVKFSLGFGIGSDFFFEVPRRLAAAVIQRWVLTQRPGNPPLPSLVMYCSNDLVVCGLYDDNGIISGLQIGVSILYIIKLFNSHFGLFDSYRYKSYFSKSVISKYYNVYALISCNYDKWINLTNYISCHRYQFIISINYRSTFKLILLKVI